MKAYATKSGTEHEPANPNRQSKRSSKNGTTEASGARDVAMPDARAGATAQLAWMDIMDRSPQRQRVAALQAKVNDSPIMKAQEQLQAVIAGRPYRAGQPEGLNRNAVAAVQRERMGHGELQLKTAPSVTAQLQPSDVVQRLIVAGINVNKKTNMPSWEQGDERYHINLTTATSHVSKEGSPMVHYFFEGTGTDITDKQPTKSERGGRSKKKVKGVKGKIKTKTVFSVLPSPVQAFIKTNWDAIVG